MTRCSSSTSTDCAVKDPNSKIRARTQKRKTENIVQNPDIARMNWIDNEGLELFDILGKNKLKKFDEKFYKDQKTIRSRKIQNK